MRLADLIEGLSLRVTRGSADLTITDLADDSRKATPGCLFIARTGPQEDGGAYIADAVARGAAAVVGRDPSAVPEGVACVVGDTIDQALTGELAERFFDRPSRKLTLIGVTGTSGKTTTTFLIQHLLHQVGMKAGLIGTVVLDDGKDRRPAELTTPGAIEFSRLLAAMFRHGCQAAVAEVSSHALHQGRVAALSFDAAVVTNLTGDHLDYHGTMDAYADAKAILFASLGPTAWAIVNADDAWGDRLLRDSKARVIWTTVGGVGRDEGKTCRATLIETDPTGSRARFDGPWGSVDVKLPLVGRHNVANTLQAVAAANAVSNGLGRVLRHALATLPQVPGRLERVSVPHTGAIPSVLVDYAHKTDAVENVLSALKPLVKPPGQLVCVFGCGGDRDRTKRPKMAAAACRWADRVVVTSDNPRTEDPHAIIDEVLTGVPADARPRVTVEADRAKAIALAIANATEHDTVLIAGKGHEDYQIIGKEKRHFDDREQAAEALGDWVRRPRGTDRRAG